MRILLIIIIILLAAIVFGPIIFVALGSWGIIIFGGACMVALFAIIFSNGRWKKWSDFTNSFNPFLDKDYRNALKAKRQQGKNDKYVNYSERNEEEQKKMNDPEAKRQTELNNHKKFLTLIAWVIIIVITVVICWFFI